jgi:hypothetical protein
MLKKKFIQALLSIIISFQSIGLFADCVIKGRIINSTDKTPVEGASIWIGKNGGYSDKNGVFTIVVPDIKISDTLRIQFIGYRITGFTGISCQNDTMVLDSIPLFYMSNPSYEPNEKPPSGIEGIAEYEYLFKKKYYEPQLFPKGTNIILYDLADRKRE